MPAYLDLADAAVIELALELEYHATVPRAA
jgi:hypothetical protein